MIFFFLLYDVNNNNNETKYRFYYYVHIISWWYLIRINIHTLVLCISFISGCVCIWKVQVKCPSARSINNNKIDLDKYTRFIRFCLHLLPFLWTFFYCIFSSHTNSVYVYLIVCNRKQLHIVAKKKCEMKKRDIYKKRTTMTTLKRPTLWSLMYIFIYFFCLFFPMYTYIHTHTHAHVMHQ